MKVALRLFFFKYSISVKILKDPHEIFLNHIPTYLEEANSKIVRDWSIVTSHTIDYLCTSSKGLSNRL